jgi:uncharacterized protein (DUF4415 family)
MKPKFQVKIAISADLLANFTSTGCKTTGQGRKIPDDFD